jgi:hypothetical protein
MRLQPALSSAKAAVAAALPPHAARPDPSPTDPPRLPHLPTISAVVVSSFLVYFVTLPPTVVGGDSGDIVVAGVTGSVAHPPGYPLMTAIAAAAHRFLPLAGEPSYRIAAANAALAALAAGFVCASACHFSHPSIAATAAFLFAFGRLIWTYSVTPEVFALNNLFSAAACLAFIHIAKSLAAASKPSTPTPCLSAHRRQLIACALASGIALCNQHTFLLLVLPIAVAVFFITPNSLRSPSHCMSYLGAALAGMLPYAILPWRAWQLHGHAHELLSWGNQLSLSGFFLHLFRSEYGSVDLISGLTGSGFFANILFFSSLCWRDLTSIGLAGLIYLFYTLLPNKTKKASAKAASIQPDAYVLRVLFCSALLYILFFAWRANIPIDVPLLRGVVARFYMQPHVLLSVLAAAGLQRAFDRFQAFFYKPLHSHKTCIGMACAVVVAVGLVTVSFHEMDLSHDTFAADYVKGLLAPLPPNAVLLTKGDATAYPLRYVQSVLQFRTDVTCLDQETMGFPWATDRIRKLLPHAITLPPLPLRRFRPSGKDAFNLAQLLALNQNRTIFIIDAKDGDSSWTSEYRFLPFGGASLIQRRNILPPSDPGVLLRQGAAAFHHLHTLAHIDIPKKFDYDTWEALFREEYWAARHRQLISFLTFKSEFKDGSLQAALYVQAAYKLGVDILYDPAHDRTWNVYKNSAIAAELYISALKSKILPIESESRYRQELARASFDLLHWLRNYINIAQQPMVNHNIATIPDPELKKGIAYVDKVASELAVEYSETFYEDTLWQLKAANMLASSSEPGSLSCKLILQEENGFISSSKRYSSLGSLII